MDNTFLTPALQVPLDLGADITLHSTTKFIEGHNSTVGGAIITKTKKDHEESEVHPERDGTDPVAVQCMADDSRVEDAGRQDEEALRECTDHR